MRLYDVLKTVHVLAVVIWVGGGFTQNVIGTRAVRSGDGRRMAAFGRDAAWMGTAVYMPASIIVLVFGVWATIDGNWSFGDWWISAGFLGIIVTAITGAAVLGPEAKRLGALVEQRGPEDAEVKRRVNRLVAIARIDLVVLVAVIAIMVIGSSGG